MATWSVAHVVIFPSELRGRRGYGGQLLLPHKGGGFGVGGKWSGWRAFMSIKFGVDRVVLFFTYFVLSLPPRWVRKEGGHELIMPVQGSWRPPTFLPVETPFSVESRLNLRRQKAGTLVSIVVAECVIAKPIM